MKQQLSLFIKRLFLATGVYALLRKRYPNSHISILRYHSVVAPEKNFYTSPPIALTREQFEAQVRYLSKTYTVLSLDEAVDLVKSGQAPPPNSIVFTFDDGYADNLEAARILKRYNASGTFYLITEPIGRESRFWLAEVTYLILKSAKSNLNIELNGEALAFQLSDKTARWKAIRTLVRLIKSNNRTLRDGVIKQLRDQLGEPGLLLEVEELMLNWTQAKEMQAMGMVIGAHTLSHLNLPNADPEDARREISGARAVLEEKIGISCRHFSYPNSGPYDYFNNRIRQYVIDAGYDSSCTSNQGFFTLESDLYAIDRVRTVPELAEVIHGMEWDRVFGS